MPVRLRPGLRALWRSADSAQIGTDPRWAVVVDGLDAADHDLLLALERPASRRTLAARARTAPRGGRADELIAALDARGLVVDAPDDPADEPTPAPLLADALAWSVLRADGDGAATLRGRGERAVAITGLGRLGVGLALTLAGAGVGTLVLDDARPVRPADLGGPGYRARDLGLPRREAAARLVTATAPRVRTVGGVGDGRAGLLGGVGTVGTVGDRFGPGDAGTALAVDLAVLVARGAADPRWAHAQLAAGTPHLAIVVREADVAIGPLVLPGRTACLRCLDLHRSGADPRWPAVATQLAAPDPDGDPGEETAIATAAAGLAAGHALALLDGRASALLGASLEIELPGLVPRLRTWQPHPACGCIGWDEG